MRRQSVSLLSACAAGFSAAPPATWFDKEIPLIIARIAASPNRPALAALAATAPSGLRGHIEAALAATPDTAPTTAVLPDHLTAGRDSYLKTCTECHQANGEGVPDTFPPLAGSERVKGDADTILRIMLGGLAGPIEIQGGKFDGVMPGHSHLKDEEIAAIASFVRHSFGGIEENAIPPERVKALRPEVEKRNFKPWSAEELRKPGVN
jgi:mono/diheme cytochrome c family protein